MSMADCDPILSYIKPGWKGVEIGVSRGHSALALLEHKVGFLWLVDPWCDHEGYLEGEGQNWSEVFLEAMKRLAHIPCRYSVIRTWSAEAAQWIPDNLDFVWIDGNHRYEWVKSDMELYWPKLKEGGILCGHDYCNVPPTCEVKKAVDQFCDPNNVSLFPDSSCWMIRK
jgi:Methyltransferase domain